MSSSVEHPRELVALAPATTAIVPTVDQVADAFDLFDRAYQWFRNELDEISVCQDPLSQTCVNRLVALGGRMQPAAAARTLLSRVSPNLIIAGVAVWVSRQRATGSDYQPAAMRACRLWAAGGAER